MRCLKAILMSLLALRLLGGDFAVLQVVAWSGMIVARTADQGVAAAVESTFDGEHPCPLCRALADAKAPAKPEAPLPEGWSLKLKLKDVLPSDDLVFVRPAPLGELTSPLPSSPEFRVLSRTDAPAVPPPQGRWS